MDITPLDSATPGAAQPEPARRMPAAPWLRVALGFLPAALPALLFLPMVLAPPINHVLRPAGGGTAPTAPTALTPLPELVELERDS